MGHYNTTHEKGSLLEKYEAQALKQEMLILHTVQTFEKPISPYMVERLLIMRGYEYPITSIRRALSNLTKAGKLAKTGIKVTGKYSRPEHCWAAKNYNHEN